MESVCEIAWDVLKVVLMIVASPDVVAAALATHKITLPKIDKIGMRIRLPQSLRVLGLSN
jgi:hypothetical protein